MIIAQHPEILVSISTILLSLYYTLIKQFPKHKMLLYFWLHGLSYVGFACIYIFKESILTFETVHVEQLVFDTSYINFPLYVLSAACLLGTYIILEKLINIYPVSSILALSQLSLLLSTIGYVILGDNMSLISTLGVVIIVTGSIVSGLQHFTWKNPLLSLKAYDQQLLGYSIIKAILYSSTILITYLCTAHHNETTKHILHVLTKHMHFIPFVAIAPLHFNLGVQFANFFLMFLFIRLYLKEQDGIILIFKQNYMLILQLSTLYVFYAYCYYEAYDFIENKNIIKAIAKLYLPLTLFFSYLAYKQKVTKEQIVGMGIIISGSIISIWG